MLTDGVTGVEGVEGVVGAFGEASGSVSSAPLTLIASHLTITSAISTVNFLCSILACNHPINTQVII